MAFWKSADDPMESGGCELCRGLRGHARLRKVLYDELDEEYDRGRVAKHARRREAKQKLAGKAPAFGSKLSAAAGSKRNPFQSKARSKASDE